MKLDIEIDVREFILLQSALNYMQLELSRVALLACNDSAIEELLKEAKDYKKLLEKIEQ